MYKNKWLLAILSIFILVGAWYIFRPEKLFIDKEVNEQLPTAPKIKTETSNMKPPKVSSTETKIVSQGKFRNGDTAHKGKGNAAIYQLPDGKRILRFTEFETDNGPDVKIYLVTLPEIEKSSEVTKENSISLGKMKGNKGDQNYEIPDNVDLKKYGSVSIWCERFSVNFASASLKMEVQNN